jgi:hypothetical protein
MENINTNIELEQMKEQLSVLKGKLDKEAIVNDRLMRNIMNQKVKSIKRHGRTFIILTIIFIPYCTWAFMHMHMSVWFTAVTDIFMLIALIYDYFAYKDIKSNELMEGDLIDVKRKMINFKRKQADWLKIGIPFIILWLAWFAIENLNQADAKFVLIGGIVGGVIGACIGFKYFLKIRRMATEVIGQIEELED